MQQSERCRRILSWCAPTNGEGSTVQRSNPRFVIACLALASVFTGVAVGQGAAAEASPSTWSLTPSPNKGTVDELGSVSCIGSTDCFAVGYHHNARGVSETLIERWNGTSWAVDPSPNVSGGFNSLRGVYCVSSTYCIAVGSYLGSGSSSTPDTLAETWDGTTWSILSSPDPSTTENEFNAVYCVDASECLAVGYTWTGSGETAAQVPLIAWLDEGTWSVQTSPRIGRGALFDAVSCTSTVSCVAVGDWVNGNTDGTETLAESLSGTSWAIDTTPDPSGVENVYSGLFCKDPSYCVAVGWSDRVEDATFAPKTLVSTWNGTTWSVIQSPDKGQVSQLNGLSCIKVNDCVATGFFAKTITASTKTLVESWNGSAWSVTPTPSRAGGDNYLNGVSCSNAQRCQAIGYYSSQAGSSATLAESGKK
jgi:hypothetical protein